MSLGESTLPIDESVCLTATIDILRDIAKGTGPDKALLALGYAGCAPGQLESEIGVNINQSALNQVVSGGTPDIN